MKFEVSPSWKEVVAVWISAPLLQLRDSGDEQARAFSLTEIFQQGQDFSSSDSLPLQNALLAPGHREPGAYPREHRGTPWTG
ncbi:hypothetical protein AMELA_G00077530 [Ameiurus melas]|uniref:Uncharacterized protein n=1 Tax=Ameiurus melas TaxID=219545 RepID=A0A7J6AYN6_AMEME|nr:hypothetical protein AMELA_G00077530 [Ameiurus melas]